MKKGNKIILSVIIFIISILSGFGVFYIYDLNIKDNQKNNNQENDTNLVNDNGDKIVDINNYKNILNVTKNDFLTYEVAYGKEIVYKIKTKTKDAKLITPTENIALYYDDGFKYYNVKEDKVMEFNWNFSSDILEEKNIRLHISKDKNKIIGLSVCKDTDEEYEYGGIIPSCSYYSYSTKNKLHSIENIKKEIVFLNDEVIKFYLWTGYDDRQEEIINVVENKVVFKGGNEDTGNYNFSIFGKSDNYILMSITHIGYSFYSKDGKIFEEKIPFEKVGLSSNNKNIFVSKDNLVYTYELDKLVSKREFNNVQKMRGDYITYLDNNELVLEHLITGEKNKLIEWDDNYYYEALAINDYSQDENKQGVYVLISFKDQHNDLNHASDPGIELFYKFKTKQIEKKELKQLADNSIGMCWNCD